MRSALLTLPRRVTSRSLAALLALSANLAAGGPTAPAQEGARIDQIFVWNPRRAEMRVESGLVTGDELSGVEWTSRDGKKKDTAEAAFVRQIIFGEVPASYADGRTYVERGDVENAVAQLRIAAQDTDARPAVRAAAHHALVQELLLWGKSDRSRFAEAAGEAERFAAAHATSRLLPSVRYMRARATWLAGEHKKASELYRALFAESEGPTAGYPADLCTRAGLEGAHALLVSGNAETLAARELFATVEARATNLSGELAENDPLRRTLAAHVDRARLGEGFALLVTPNQERAAKTFFEGKVEEGKRAGAELRFGALLGLALAQQKLGEQRAAQLTFSRVAALDPADPDRTARALVGLAETTLALNDQNAKDKARVWLGEVVARYGDTPAAAAAVVLLGGL